MDFNSAGNESGRVCVALLRDVKSAAAGGYAHLMVDEMPTALVKPGERVQFFLEPGVHTVGVAALEVSPTDASHSVTLEMQADMTYRFRIYLDSHSNKLLVELCSCERG